MFFFKLDFYEMNIVIVFKQTVYDIVYIYTGCPIWIATKINECCDYVFQVRHFSFQIHAESMCTF